MRSYKILQSACWSYGRHYLSLLIFTISILSSCWSAASSLSQDDLSATNDSVLLFESRQESRKLDTNPPGGKRWIMSVGNGHFDTTCQFAGKPLCCKVSDESLGYYPKKHISSTSSRNKGSSTTKQTRFMYNHNPHKCDIHMEYIPSPYEIRHLIIAREISQLPHETARNQALFDFIWKDISDSNTWLRKVRLRGRVSNSSAVMNEKDDREYLSRFHYTQTCNRTSSTRANNTVKHTYDEWVEPLTVHGRHPFAWLKCPRFHKQQVEYDNRGTITRDNNQHKIQVEFGNEGIYDTKYILLASEEVVSIRASVAKARRTTTAASSAAPQQQAGGHSHSSHSSSREVPKQYLLDAGTSRFDSSLWWFTCAYAQRGISFDHLYGWEVNYFEQAEFWQRIPPAIVPIYSFYNHPVSEKEGDGTSLVRLVKHTAREEDFVSFKLDIDTTSVELPIAMQLLKDSSFNSLVDEFFFELHFKCEIMQVCGWEQGAAVPESYEGFKLERFSVMTFFQDLRRRGVRAHTWV